MRKPITIEGKTFKSVKEACNYYNLGYKLVCYRLEKGWSIEEAFELVDKKGTRKQITLEGKTFKSITEAIKYYNINAATVRIRLHRGWSIEEAFELVPRQKKKR